MEGEMTPTDKKYQKLINQETLFIKVSILEMLKGQAISLTTLSKIHKLT